MRCQKPGLILGADDVGLGDELKKRMLQRHLAEKLLQVAWSCQTSAAFSPCGSGLQGRQRGDFPGSWLFPAPFLGMLSQPAQPPLLWAGPCSSPPLGGQGVGSSSRILSALPCGFRKVEESLLWTQGPLKSLESQPGSFLILWELDHQESPGTALWEEC